MTNKCEVCGTEFESIKVAKTCSPKCRVTLSRFGVTRDPNVTLAEPSVTHEESFSFRIKDQPTRTARYWYDVPLNAAPVIQKGWPELPDYMNARQYFL